MKARSRERGGSVWPASPRILGRSILGWTAGVLALSSILAAVTAAPSPGLQSEQEYNPFVIVDSESQDWYFNGVLKNTQQVPASREGETQRGAISSQAFLKEQNQVYRRLQPDAEQGLGADSLSYQHIDPEVAAAGADNHAAEKVNFRFALLSNYEARVQLTSAAGHNYSVTDEIFPRPVQEFEARFTQLGFQHSEAGKPFDWSLANIFTDEPVLSTKNRKFIVGDKFSEIGLLLPNDRIFGLGLSNRQFRIGTDATYTLWSRGR